MNPTNQKQMVIHYLMEWKNTLTLSRVIEDSMFYKFQTRLAEIEKEYGVITKKERLKFKNRFGHNGSHILYKRSVSKKELRRIFELLK